MERRQAIGGNNFLQPNSSAKPADKCKKFHYQTCKLGIEDASAVLTLREIKMQECKPK